MHGALLSLGLDGGPDLHPGTQKTSAGSDSACFSAVWVHSKGFEQVEAGNSLSLPLHSTILCLVSYVEETQHWLILCILTRFVFNAYFGHLGWAQPVLYKNAYCLSIDYIWKQIWGCSFLFFIKLYIKWKNDVITNSLCSVTILSMFVQSEYLWMFYVSICPVVS